MTRTGGKVHVVRVGKSGYVDKQGHRKDYSSAYLRRTYRDGGKVKNETVANLSALPDHVIDLIDAGLKGQQFVPAAGSVTITGSLPHGHVAAVHAMARELGLPALLGPAGRPRDLALALALIISRVVAPGSKLSTLTWWADTTLGADLGGVGGRVPGQQDGGLLTRARLPQPAQQGGHADRVVEGSVGGRVPGQQGGALLTRARLRGDALTVSHSTPRYLFLMRHAKHNEGHLTEEGSAHIRSLAMRSSEWIQAEWRDQPERTVRLWFTSTSTEVQETAGALTRDMLALVRQRGPHGGHGAP